MNRSWFFVVGISALLAAGCASPQRGSIPVVDAGGPLSAQGDAAAGGGSSIPDGQSLEQDSGVVVMVPGASSSAPIQSFPAPGSSTSAPLSSEPLPVGGYAMPAAPVPAAPTGIPSAGSLSADEQLDGPVLALLTTAQQQQGSGDLNGAASSLERAQRIAPREPQVLYRLAEVRLAQGDAAQAEQLARRGLTYAGGRPQLQASLWELIAQARERQADPQGAAQARERAKVAL
ncbi:tetratricopeptide repeat protein [Pseudomonas sp. N040]|uniref:tetratricopeptide repeat protein n=1 Tax=Pseudomonas sp. N040 TaxID=2785325 RepID=UPI0018A3150D|nr:tetratricopeptide repeat protein [Pseudomonas sp. N040]MBF7730436.1 hypothetical protein [Pseudomonas sp. N040]MBW7014079.1 hypothetical protein [Pseudomonas sp. N040]